MEKIKYLLSFSLLVLLFTGCSNTIAGPESQEVSNNDSRGLSGEYVILYRHINYEGATKVIYYRDGAINLDGFDNTFSSIKFSSNNFKLNIYDGRNNTGIYEVIEKSEPNILKFGFNDIASSIKFRELNDNPGFAILYNDKNFSGPQTKYIEGVKDGILNDLYSGKISSIKVTGDTKIRLHGKDSKGRWLYLSLNKGEYPDLSVYGFDNITQVVNWGPLYTVAQVFVYDEPNYKGAYRHFWLGSAGQEPSVLNEVKLWEYGFNDRAASIRTINCRVQLYDNGDKTGNTRGITGNVTLGAHNLDEKLSLIKLLYKLD